MGVEDGAGWGDDIAPERILSRREIDAMLMKAIRPDYLEIFIRAIGNTINNLRQQLESPFNHR